jgi:hypothetical protein
MVILAVEFHFDLGFTLGFFGIYERTLSRGWGFGIQIHANSLVT